MIPTGFGIAIAIIGFGLLIRGSVPALYGFTLLCSLLGGSAAFILPALGGSSIPPIHFALGFLILRLLLPGSGQRALVQQSLRENILLVVFVLYGLALAYAGPRIFEHRIRIVPMRVNGGALFATSWLVPSAQNITASVYLIGTLMCAVAAFVACRTRGGAETLVTTGLWIACIHMAFGITGVLFADTGYAAFLDLFRNGSYAQLDQRIGTIVRMNGIMPEPSSFAGFGFAWFVFLAECWFRGVRPGVTGPVALALAATLLASTSSTAYVSIAGYALVVVARTLCAPIDVPTAKLVRIALVLLALAIVFVTLLLLMPAFVAEMGTILSDMTVNKQKSDSALQRSFWAQQGLKAFVYSAGLGVGPGSFRSSSLPTAILGATGIVGAIAFTAYLVRLLKPLRASTYSRVVSTADATGVAAAWTALCILIPASVTSPTADPGSDFALFAGASLALRLRARKAEAVPAAMAARDHLDQVAATGPALAGA